MVKCQQVSKKTNMEGDCKVCMSANCYCDIECCSCCGGECYDPETQGCCEDLTIYNKSTEKCCYDGQGNTCPKDKICCKGECCDPGQLCCNGTGNYNCIAWSAGITDEWIWSQVDQDAKFGDQDGITHAARKTDYGWWESKCGSAEKIDHMRDALNDTSETASYGEHFRYYKPK